MIRKTEYIIICIYWILLFLNVSGQTYSSNGEGVVSYNEVVSQGLRFQIQADSMLRLIDAKNAQLSSVSEAEKRGIRLAILNYDIQAVKLQKSADELFLQAIALQEKTVSSFVSEVETELTISQNNKPKFAILSKSPYSTTNPIPIDEPLPDGVVYKIQLGAFSRALPTNAFRGLSPVSGEKLDSGATKYYVGLFWMYTDADDALRKVREYGFKDAFIVAFFNRKPVSSERAKQLE